MDLLESFGFKNFRQFEKFNSLNLSKLNILTGPNNSGKSTFIKALLLFGESQKQWSDKDLWGERLDFRNINYDYGGISANYNDINNTLCFYIGFREYYFCYEFDENGELIYNYKITQRDKLVIQQAGGNLQINLEFFSDFLKQFRKDYKFENTINNILYTLEEYRKRNTSYLSLILEDSDEEYPVPYIYQSDIDFGENKELTDYVKLSGLAVDFDIDEADLNLEATLNFLFSKFFNIKDIEKEFFNCILPNLKPDHKILPKLFYLPSFKFGGVKRSYSMNDRSIFKDLIQNYVENNNNSSYRTFFPNKKVFDDFFIEWLRKFDIPESINIDFDEIRGVYYITIDNKSIIDYGLGTAQIISIMLWIDSIKSNSNKYRDFRPILILEEPETNLHPDLQSKFIEFIVEMMEREDFQVLIETHSEYFIRKIQYLTATKKIEKDKTKIFYFNKTKSDVRISEIAINEDGSLTEDFGSGFMDEADNIALALYKIQKKNLN